MNNDPANKSLVERLRTCSKFDCRFWSRRNYDGDVSDLTFEEDFFFKNRESNPLHLAAKRFESSAAFSVDLSTGLNNDCTVEKPVPCSDDEIGHNSDSQMPHTSTILTPNGDFGADKKTDNKPELEVIHDEENSFSSSSTNTFSCDEFRERDVAENQPFYRTKGMNQHYERMINTSESSSSYNTPNHGNVTGSLVLPHETSSSRRRASRDQDHSMIFSDVKTAKSLNLFIDEYPETSFFSLLESLQSNRGIERIVVFRNRAAHGELRARTLEDVDNLFHVIHGLAKSLIELVLWNFLPNDLPSVCLGIAKHPSIGNLQLHMENGTLDEQSLETIVCMPSLVSFELDVNESFPIWSLLESKSLVLLGVVSTRFDFEPNDVLRLAGRIRTNSVLRFLDLEPRIPSWCIGAVMASLRFSHTSKLEAFRFSCENDNEDQGDACMAEILKTIEYETPLRVLWNHSRESFSVGKEIRRKTISAVSRNPSLEQFHLFADNAE